MIIGITLEFVHVYFLPFLNLDGLFAVNRYRYALNCHVLKYIHRAFNE